MSEEEQRINNAILDCENDITAFMEGLRVKRNELAKLKRELFSITNPGHMFQEEDLF